MLTSPWVSVAPSSCLSPPSLSHYRCWHWPSRAHLRAYLVSQSSANCCCALSDGGMPLPFSWGHSLCAPSEYVETGWPEPALQGCSQPPSLRRGNEHALWHPRRRRARSGREAQTPSWPRKEACPGRNQVGQSSGCNVSSVWCHLQCSPQRNGQLWWRQSWPQPERGPYCILKDVPVRQRCSSSFASHLVCWPLQEEQRLSAKSKEQTGYTQSR